VAAIQRDIATLFDVDPADPATWTPFKLPAQTRRGLYQNVVGNLDSVWDIRAHERVNDVFRKTYGVLRGRVFGNSDLYTSIDGINLCPPKTAGRGGSSTDWAHLDQTTRHAPLACVQGQVVLTDTSASFVCSPGSNHVYSDLLDMAGAPTDASNWCKFKHELYPKLAETVERAGGQWQVPVKARAGSVILWLSSTVHSASHQDPGDATWRAVVYVCQRPKVDCKPDHYKRLKQCLETNRLTNHWGTRVFPKASRFFALDKSKYSPTVVALTENPALVYERLPRSPRNDEAIARLTSQ